MRHLCQSLNLLSVQPEPFSNATAVIWVGLVEQGCLAQLDAFFRIAQVVYNITDQVIPILVSHHPSVKLPGLKEIVVGVGVWLA